MQYCTQVSQQQNVVQQRRKDVCDGQSVAGPEFCVRSLQHVCVRMGISNGTHMRLCQLAQPDLLQPSNCNPPPTVVCYSVERGGALLL